MYKIMMENQYPTIQNHLEISYPQHEYATRTINSLIMPFPRVETIRMNLKYQFVKIWNEIPHNIPHSVSYKIFKTSLMNYFIENY